MPLPFLYRTLEIKRTPALLAGVLLILIALELCLQHCSFDPSQSVWQRWLCFVCWVFFSLLGYMAVPLDMLHKLPGGG